MDWGNVTADELWSALQEVDWASSKPRPLIEFFSKFSSPKNQAKLAARMKCNVYYYRGNYVLLLLTPLICAFYRNPGALLAVIICFLAGLCMNDTFATTLSDRGMRFIRKVNPSLAVKIRASTGGHSGIPTAPGVPPKAKAMKICGIPRLLVVAALLLLGLTLLYYTRGLLVLIFAVIIGNVAVVLHAALRSPNLKARLASAREEFRAVWRGYQADYHDYTL